MCNYMVYILLFTLYTYNMCTVKYVKSVSSVQLKCVHSTIFTITVHSVQCKCVHCPFPSVVLRTQEGPSFHSIYQPCPAITDITLCYTFCSVYDLYCTVCSIQCAVYCLPYGIVYSVCCVVYIVFSRPVVARGCSINTVCFTILIHVLLDSYIFTRLVHVLLDSYMFYQTHTCFTRLIHVLLDSYMFYQTHTCFNILKVLLLLRRPKQQTQARKDESLYPRLKHGNFSYGIFLWGGGGFKTDYNYQSL